jgi:HPt (histidine-containing phosphotransfer) domain-containing protein
VAISRLIRIALLQNDRSRVASLAHENLRVARTVGSLSSVLINLHYLVSAARMEDRPERAARLMGAAEMIGETTGRRESAVERHELDAEVALLRESLGEAAFTTAWDEGRALSTDLAVRYALEEIDVEAGW